MQGNPVSMLSVLPHLPTSDDKAFRQRVRLGLENALRSLPPQRRQKEVLAALAVSTNVGTTKVLLRFRLS